MDVLIGGRIDMALRQLHRLYGRYLTDQLSELVVYLAHNAEWIGDYDQLRSQGYPVGSGSVEEAVDIVINRRLKCRSGMSWWRSNADGVVSLRTLMLNDDWDKMWSHHNVHI